MCMDCPEQQEGAEIQLARVIDVIESFTRLDNNRTIDAVDLITRLLELPELTNEDADNHYKRVNN